MLPMRSAAVRTFLSRLLVLLAVCPTLLAQEKFRLQAVRVTGSQRFHQEDLIASTGLKPGDTVDVDALRSAADRMMVTGALAGVQYKYTPLSNGMLVEFTVTDSTDFLPCRYENLVWIAGDELTKAVHEKVPLYDGEAPSSGELLDQIKQAITDVLAQRGILTIVRYELHARGVGGPIDAISFVSDSVRPRVQEITLTGTTLLTPEQKTESTKRLIGDEYTASSLHDSLTETLFSLYGNKGYLRMQVGEPQAKLMGDPKQVLVAVTVPVTEGAQYRWKSVTWTGNSAIATAELDKAVSLRPGDIADHSKLDQAMSQVQRDYKSKGYLNAKLQRTPDFDDTGHTVSYGIKVTEGDMFRMGTIHIGGLDQVVLNQLQKNWKLKPGDPYDQEYLQSFLHENVALITGTGRAKTVKVLQTPTSDKHVNVILEF